MVSRVPDRATSVPEFTGNQGVLTYKAMQACRLRSKLETDVIHANIFVIKSSLHHSVSGNPIFRIFKILRTQPQNPQRPKKRTTGRINTIFRIL